MIYRAVQPRGVPARVSGCRSVQFGRRNGAWQVTLLTQRDAAARPVLSGSGGAGRGTANLPTPTRRQHCDAAGAGKSRSVNTRSRFGCVSGRRVHHRSRRVWRQLSEVSPTPALTNTTAALRTRTAPATPTCTCGLHVARPIATRRSAIHSATAAGLTSRRGQPRQPILLKIAVTPGTNPTSGASRHRRSVVARRTGKPAILRRRSNGDVVRRQRLSYCSRRHRVGGW